MRSLEPKLRKSWTGGKSCKFSDSADRSPRIIKLQGMKLLTGFRRMSLPVGRAEIRCEKETGSPCKFRDAGLKSCTATWRANGVLLKRRLLQMFLEMIQLSSLQRKWKITEWWEYKSWSRQWRIFLDLTTYSHLLPSNPSSFLSAANLRQIGVSECRTTSDQPVLHVSKSCEEWSIMWLV